MNNLSKIKAAGFTLERDGGDLVIAPFSKLTPPQVLFLKSHKAEIIRELRREQAGHEADSFDDRHYCRECPYLINSRCVVQMFRPVDDIPRRCEDFLKGTTP